MKDLFLSKKYLWGVWNYAVYPVLERLVKDSSNSLDDAALGGVHAFATFFLKPSGD